MTPDVLRKTANAVWARLRNSPAGAVLSEECRKALLGRITAFPERSSEIIATIAVPFGSKGGWFSLWRTGGGLKVIIWVPPTLYREENARDDVEEVRRLLGGVQHLGEIQLRVLEERRIREWLAQKGWPLEEEKMCTRH